MLPIGEPRAKTKSRLFLSSLQDGLVFWLHFPALRTGLFSLSPSGTSSHRTILCPWIDADGPLPDRLRLDAVTRPRTATHAQIALSAAHF